MAITYAAALKTARMQAVADAIDAAATAGYIEIGTASMASILATVTLDDPCGTVTGDTLDFTLPASDLSVDANGNAQAARIKDGDGNIIISGLTVGATGSGANIELSSTSLSIGDAVTLTSGTIQHA